MARIFSAAFLPSVLLLLLLHASVSQAASTGQAELNGLVGYLNKNGYKSLVAALVQQGLDKALLAALDKGTKITVLAPPDRAFAFFKPRCKVVLKNVLLDHVLPGYFPAAAVRGLPDRTKVTTLGPNQITKIRSYPLHLGIFKGTKLQSFAKVFHRNAYSSKQTIVHGINRVLYSC